MCALVPTSRTSRRAIFCGERGLSRGLVLQTLLQSRQQELQYQKQRRAAAEEEAAIQQRNQVSLWCKVTSGVDLLPLQCAARALSLLAASCGLIIMSI